MKDKANADSLINLAPHGSGLDPIHLDLREDSRKPPILETLRAVVNSYISFVSSLRRTGIYLLVLLLQSFSTSCHFCLVASPAVPIDLDIDSVLDFGSRNQS